MIFNMTITGTSSTKSIMIISIDSGSTVAAYSDAACTTLVKNATEKSSGEFWITNVDNGTYYIKATKDSDEVIKSCTISEYGVYRITMNYWAATIAVSFSTDTTLLTCSDGVNTISASGDLSGGTYTFTVDHAETWTITASNGRNSISDSVIVDAQTTYSLTLPSLIPNTYQEVGYIENTGTQYIVTNHQAGLDYTLTINIQVGGTSQNRPVFSSSEGKYYSMTCWQSAWSIGINGSFVDGNGSYSPVIGTEYDIVFNDSNHDCIVNGTTIKSNMNATANGKLVIGARLKGGDGSSVDVYGAYRFEYAKLTQISTGDVIMELIPCYRILDSVAGMWDRVDKVFYTNSGSGTFVVGADV